jgi:transposase
VPRIGYHIEIKEIEGQEHDAEQRRGRKVRYSLAYSPDLNPIEMAFSKLKTALRKGAARTVTR